MGHSAPQVVVAECGTTHNQALAASKPSRKRVRLVDSFEPAFHSVRGQQYLP